MNSEPAAAEAIGLTRTFAAGRHEVAAVRGVSLTVAPAQVVAVMGPSGSGKSTLLYLLAGLDRPDGGTARVAGVDWESLEKRERAQFRRRNCGFVAQGLSLLPQATASENVEVPLLLDGVEPDVRGDKVTEALARVGLTAHATKLPDQLSGGEQQRVAIARALVTGAPLILADEPTGSLDSVTAQSVTHLLTELAGEQGTAVLLATHDPTIAAQASRIVTLQSGQIDTDSHHQPVKSHHQPVKPPA